MRNMSEAFANKVDAIIKGIQTFTIALETAFDARTFNNIQRAFWKLTPPGQRRRACKRLVRDAKWDAYMKKMRDIRTTR